VNRQELIELSPWLLNGSLTESEREELLAQLKQSVESRTDLADTAFVASLFARRPATATLAALAFDEPISDQERELVDLHLELDPEIAAELELARMSRRLLQEEVDLLRPKSPPDTLDTPVAAPPAARRRSGGWRLLAAAVLAAVLPTLLWLQSGQQVRELRSQQSVTPGWVAVNLGTERGGGNRGVWQFNPGVVAEIYPANPLDACAQCTVEILAEDGRVLHSGPLQIQGGDFYPMQMHLPVGHYTVSIYALPKAAGAVPENSFEIEIVD